MALDGGDIVLPIKLSTEEAEAMWAALKEKLERNPPKPPSPYPGKPPPEPLSWFDKLRDKMTEYRADETKNARAARFFANELSNLLPVGSGVASVAAKLSLAFAGGLGFGTAVELTKLLVEQWVDLYERGKVLEGQARKMGAELVQAAFDARAAWAQFQLQFSTQHVSQTEAFTRQRAQALVKTTGDAQREVKRLQAELTREGAKLEEWGLDAILRYGTEAQRKLAEELQKQRQILDKARAESIELSKGKRGAFGKEFEAQQPNVDRQVQELLLKGYGERRQIEAQGERALAELRLNAAKYAPEQIQQLEIANKRATNQALLVLDMKFAAEERQIRLAARKLTMDEVQAVEADGAEAVRKLQDQVVLAWEAGDAKEAERLEERIRLQEELNQASLAHAQIQRMYQEQEAAAGVRQKGYDAALEEAKANMEKLRAAKALAAGLDPNDQTKVREELKLLDEVAAKYGQVAGVLEMVEKAKSRIVETESQKRMRQWRDEHEFQALALDMTATMVGQQFAKMATHAGAYDRAMRAAGKSQAATASEMEGAALAWTQEVLAAIAQQAAIKAIFQLAEGFGNLAWGNAGSASLNFQSAALYGSIAAVSAVAGNTIGEYRPMTQEERGQVEGGTSSTSAGSTSGTSSRGASAGPSWRDAGVDMSDRGKAAAPVVININNALDGADVERHVRKYASAYLRVQAEWASARRTR